MARPTASQVRGIGTAQVKYRWNVTFCKFPSAIAAPPRTEDINLRCESIEQPEVTIAPSKMEIRGHEVNQPGKLKYKGTIKLTLVETIDNLVSKFLRDWREQMWATDTGLSKPKAQLEAEILLHRLSPDDKPNWEFRLIGCLLESPTAGGALDNSPDGLKPELGIVYDLFKDRPL